MTIANIEISNFVRGLITEASLLSFPEGASLDELNMKLLNDGTRERRLGLNRELNGVVHDTELTDEDLRDLRVSYHDWPMPNNNPRLHIGAIQIGAKLWFIDVTKPNPSAHLLNGGASIAADVVGDVAVISTYINGNLLLTSVSFGTPVLLLYNEDTDTVSSVSAPILIRDLSGVHDGLAINERPNTLSSEHLYNLRNQGWSDDIVVASIAEEQHIGFPEGVGASSGNITVGGIIVAVISSDTAWDVATKIAAAINNQITDNATFPIRADANGTNVLRIFYDKRDGNVAQIAVVDASTLLAAVPISNTAVHGVDNSAVTAITAVFTKLGVYPSNSDLVQLGMIPDLTDPDVYSFDADVWYQNSHLSTGEAPKGHYVIDAFNRKASREAVSGISPLVSDIELGRLGVCTTYAGRVFYGGVLSRISDADSRSRNASGTLYFGQIGASLNTLVNAYQQFDPTNKDLNELLPTDGGTIEITGCSVQTRMISSEGSLFVFTERGIWEIKGGENGFTATEFSVNKISNIGVISPYSVVEINGVFMFWAREGIYRLSRNQFGRWESTSMTIPTIQTMFNSITDEAKRHVKGYFDLSKHQVRWMYHSSGAKVVGSHDVPPGMSEIVLFVGPIAEITPLGRHNHIFAFSSSRVIDLHLLDTAPFTYRYRLLDTSGDEVTVLSVGDAPTLVGGTDVAQSASRISDSKMLLVYKGNSDSYARACVVTLSGVSSDIISFGTPVDLEATDGWRTEHLVRELSLDRLEEGKYLLAGQSKLSGGMFIAQIINVSGSDVITPEAIVVSSIPSGTMSFNRLAVLAPGKAVVGTNDHGRELLFINISGSTITFETPYNIPVQKPWNPPWDIVNQLNSSSFTPRKIPGVEKVRVATKIQLQNAVDGLVFREGWLDVDATFTVSNVQYYDIAPSSSSNPMHHYLSSQTADVSIALIWDQLAGTHTIWAGFRQGTTRTVNTRVSPEVIGETMRNPGLITLSETKSVCRYNRVLSSTGVSLSNSYAILKLE